MTTTMHCLPVETWNRDSIAMTVGHRGKNFIKWTESTDKITRIWHNKENNQIEITGEDCPDETFTQLKKTIIGVLNFNAQVLSDRLSDDAEISP